MTQESDEARCLPSEFNVDPWKIFVRKSHILISQCANSCLARENGGGDNKVTCTLCRYKEELNLPSLPDMVFGDNFLRIQHEAGFAIEFNALDALRLVNDKQDLIKVAVAKAWTEARSDSQFISDVIKPFDWTFTTSYKGSLVGETKQFLVSPTSQRIDIEKLKEHEKILFYDEVHLFEDELADHGSASCHVKIRVMPSGFFVLLRYYLRVDGVLIRINDTRLHHQLGTNYLLREYSSREKFVDNLNVPNSTCTDPNEIWPHLDLKEESIDILKIP